MMPIAQSELDEIAADMTAIMAMSADVIGMAQIQAKARTADNRGGGAEAWTTTATVPAILTAGSRLPRFQRIAEQEDVQRLWTVTVPVGTDVSEKGRILLAGHTLEVVALAGPESFATDLVVLTRTIE